MWNDKDDPKAQAKIFGSKNNEVIAFYMLKENFKNIPRTKLIFLKGFFFTVKKIKKFERIPNNYIE